MYLTSKTSFGTTRWVDTEIRGNLRLVKVVHNDLAAHPLYFVRVTATDSLGIEHDKVLEYELPLNFQCEPDLTHTFCSLNCIQGSHLGFNFKVDYQKQDFVDKLAMVAEEICNLTSA